MEAAAAIALRSHPVSDIRAHLESRGDRGPRISRRKLSVKRPKELNVIYRNSLPIEAGKSGEVVPPSGRKTVKRCGEPLKRGSPRDLAGGSIGQKRIRPGPRGRGAHVPEGKRPGGRPGSSRSSDPTGSSVPSASRSGPDGRYSPSGGPLRQVSSLTGGS